MSSIIDKVFNNVKSVCNLSGEVKAHTESGFAIHYVIEEGLVHDWVLSIQNTLKNRVKQTMSVEPTYEVANTVEFKIDEKTYVFSTLDYFTREERVISITGVVI